MAPSPRILTRPFQKINIYCSTYDCDRRNSDCDIRIDIFFQTKHQLSKERRDKIEEKLTRVLQREIDKERSKDFQIKISPDQAKKICDRYYNTKTTQEQLAKEYKVSMNVIRRILVKERKIDE